LKTVLELCVNLSIVLTVLAVYHWWAIAPLMENDSPSLEVYVVDLDKELAKAREKAVYAMWAGENVDPEEVVKNVRRKIKGKLSNLPPNAIVLDSSVVLKGGLPVDWIREHGFDGNAPRIRPSARADAQGR